MAFEIERRSGLPYAEFAERYPDGNAGAWRSWRDRKWSAEAVARA
jgi:hypothetical protein